MRRRLSLKSQPLRSGYTLVEMVVVIGMVGLLITISGTMFAALARSERNALRSATAQQTLSRLNEHFRRDVHRAKSAVLSQNEQNLPLCTLTLADGGEVRYGAAIGALERTAAADGRTHRESYRVPDARWSFHQEDGSRQVELIVDRPAEIVTQAQVDLLPRREWRFAATLSLTPISVTKPGDAP